jgi:hypothetical protein
MLFSDVVLGHSFLQKNERKEGNEDEKKEIKE